MDFTFPWPAASDPFWFYLDWAMWIISLLLVLWMVFDWIKVDSQYEESTLTSSREGEIEAVSESHQLSR